MDDDGELLTYVGLALAVRSPAPQFSQELTSSSSGLLGVLTSLRLELGYSSEGEGGAVATSACVH